jgi:hypothetical protein
MTKAEKIKQTLNKHLKKHLKKPNKAEATFFKNINF